MYFMFSPLHWENATRQTYFMDDERSSLFPSRAILNIFIYLLAALHSMWDLSSLTRDQTCASCIGSTVLTASIGSTVLTAGHPGKPLSYI